MGICCLRGCKESDNQVAASEGFPSGIPARPALRSRVLSSQLQASKTKSTRAQRPYLLIHTEYHTDYKSALQWELFLRSGAGRKWIKENVQR